MSNIILIGPFPPPVHGMGKNLALMYHELKDSGASVTKIDTSPGILERNFKYHVTKFFKVFFGLFHLFFLLLINRKRKIYVPPDGGSGIYYTLLFVLVSRIFRCECLFHHRSFSYINSDLLGMKLLTKFQDPRSLHIFLCECMRDKFLQRYNTYARCLVVSNATHTAVRSTEENVKKEYLEYRFVFLSNLSEEKGIFRFVDLVDNLRALGHKIRADIIGPAETKKVENDLLSKISGKEYFTLHGPIFGDEKFKILQSSDFFVFPTFYRTEAQPNVVFEAMSCGNIIVSTNIACLSEDLDDSFSFCNNADSSWVNKTTQQVHELLKVENKNITLNIMKSAAISKIESYKKIGDEQHNKLIELLMRN